MSNSAFEWNGNDSRAFLPTESLRESTSVFSPAPSGVSESSSPFSIGVYVCDGAGDVDSAFRPLSLFYVSEHVAKENALMSAGWYLPVCKTDVGKRFQVRVTTCMATFSESARKELAGFDRVKLGLKVNGNLVKMAFPQSLVSIPSGYPYLCHRFDGHVSSDTRTTSLPGQRHIRTFKFCRAEAKENFPENEAGSEEILGAIELVVQKGNVGPPRERALKRKMPETAPISVHNSITKGLGVSLVANGEIMVTKSSKKEDTTTSKAHVPAYGIKLFVRDRDWLVSRRIVNSESRIRVEEAPVNENGLTGWALLSSKESVRVVPEYLEHVTTSKPDLIASKNPAMSATRAPNLKTSPRRPLFGPSEQRPEIKTNTRPPKPEIEKKAELFRLELPEGNKCTIADQPPDTSSFSERPAKKIKLEAVLSKDWNQVAPEMDPVSQETTEADRDHVPFQKSIDDSSLPSLSTSYVVGEGDSF